MSDQKPTNGNGDDPRPSASPQVNEDEALHKSALFSADPVHQYFKEHSTVPRIQEEQPTEQQEQEEQVPLQQVEITESDVEERLEVPAETADAEDQSTFVRWLLKKPQPQVIITDLTNPEPTTQELAKKTAKPAKSKVEKSKKKKKKKKRKSSAKKARSKGHQPDFSLGNDILSETLADLLATQGYTKKAIRMYERLTLIYPEKSRLFAAKIEELKKIE